MSEPKRRGRPPKKKWVIKCGDGGKMYLTEITEAQKGHPTVYRYGSDDVKDAMRFSKEEAEELAKRRHASAVEVD